MNEVERWRSRAAEMRERAARAEEKTVAQGFLSLAVEYERLATEGGNWIEASRLSPPAGERPTR